MPPLAEALGRQDDPPPPGEPQRMAAGLLARAHECRDPRTTRPDARGACHCGSPLFAPLGPLARAAERLNDGQLQQGRIAIAIPLAAKKLNFIDTLKIFAMRAAKPAPRRVLANIGNEGVELPVAFHDPIMPIVGEDRGDGAPLCTTRSLRCSAPLRGSLSCAGPLRRASLPRGVLPIRPRQSPHELVNHRAERHPLLTCRQLDQQMNVIGHDHVAPDRLDHIPLQVKVLDDVMKRPRNRILDNPSTINCRQPLKPPQRDHIVIRSRIVKACQSNAHVAFTSTSSSL